MSVADLAALVNRVGYAAASRATGLPRATIYGVVTGYGRKGRPRKSTELPKRGKAAEPETRRVLEQPVTLVVLHARALVIRQDDETGELVADPDPRVVDFVYGDAYDQDRDRPFTAMYYEQDPPATPEQVQTRLADYFEIKQEALEQATDRPPRPFVQRRKEQVVVENLGSPSGAVIVGILWRFYHDARPRGRRQKGDQPARVVATEWQRPTPEMRRRQERTMGAEKVRLAYRTYKEHRPHRRPIR